MCAIFVKVSLDNVNTSICCADSTLDVVNAIKAKHGIEKESEVLELRILDSGEEEDSKGKEEGEEKGNEKEKDKEKEHEHEHEHEHEKKNEKKEQ